MQFMINRGFSAKALCICIGCCFLSQNCAGRVWAQSPDQTPWIGRDGDDPIFILRGRIILPRGVDSADILCELHEPGESAFEVYRTPLDLKDDLTFECRTKGQNRFVSILATTRDGKFQSMWHMVDCSLRANASHEIILALKKAVEYQFQTVHEGKPVANAHILISGNWITKSATSDSNGCATVLLPENDAPQGCCAFSRAGPATRFVRLPTDKTQFLPNFKLELESWEQRVFKVVGTDGKPLPDLKISFTAFDPEKIGMDLPTDFVGTSNSSGLTNSIFVSRDSLHRRYPNVLSRNMRFVSADSNADPSTIVVAPVQPDVEIRGTVKLYPGIAGGLLLRGDSFQNERVGHISTFSCRINSDGTYRAMVHPDYTYMVFVSDDSWVSQPWTGVLATSDKAFQVPDINISRGQEVQVSLTQGPDDEPESNAWVQFASQFELNFQEDGQPKSAIAGRRWALQTDENGIVTTRAAIGALNVYVNSSPWNVDERVVVISQNQPLLLSFHRDLTKQIAFSGRLKYSEDVTSRPNLDSFRIEVKTAASSGKEQKAFASVDSEGKFQGIVQDARVGLLASSSDGKYKGFSIVELKEANQGELEIPIHSVTHVRGTIRDEDGFPIRNATVNFYARPLIAWENNDAKKVDFFDLESTTGSTDELGHYSFDSLVSGSIYCAFANVGDSGHAEHLIFRHPLAVGSDLRLPTKFFSNLKCLELIPLETRIDRRLNSARLLNGNLLWIQHGPTSDARKEAFRIAEQLQDRVCRHMLPIVISSESLAKLPEAVSWMKDRNWSIAKNDEVDIAILGHDGKVLVHRTIRADEYSVSLSEILPEASLDLRKDDWNADRKINEAIKSATESNRDIWLSLISSRDPVSIALRRWQEEHREKLEKSFVLLTLDVIRDENALQIVSTLGVSANGATWNLVLDSHRAVLWKSQNPEIKGDLIYRCIDPEVLKPLLESAKQSPVKKVDLQILLESL